MKKGRAESESPDAVTLAGAVDVASFALGTAGMMIIFKGSLRLALYLIAAGFLCQFAEIFLK